MIVYDEQFIIALCQYHGLNLGYLYTDRETEDEIMRFKKLYDNILMTHRDMITQLVTINACQSLEINKYDFQCSKKKSGDLGLVRQLVCYILHRFGYSNLEISKSLGYSPPRVSASINTCRQRLREHHIRVAMTVIYSDVFTKVFNNQKDEKNTPPHTVHNGYTGKTTRTGEKGNISPRRNVGQPL